MTDQSPPFLSIGEPDLTETEIDAVIAILKKGWLTRGEECQRFEKDFCEKVQASHALAVSSCTAALHLALLIHNVGPGDEVILPSLTFASTGHTIVHCGATPVFAEIDPRTYCVDPAHVESLINPKTKAIVAVHYAGHPVDLGSLRRIANEHDLVLIEDAAHALGASFDGEPIGSGKSVACFSFYTNKNITTAEGGMLTVPTEDLLARAERLSLHGLDRDAWKRFADGKKWRYSIEEIGYKYNANDLLAALGRAQLSRLDEMQAKRRRVWDGYVDRLNGDERFILPPEEGRIEHARHLFVLRLTEESGMARDDLIDHLRAQRIGATVHYDPLHLHPAYRDRFGTTEGMLPVTEGVAKNILSVPIHPKMSEEDVERVVGTLKDFS
ncbi:MAG: DegT/DnrJ/EryC1/StrS family aminotransferase [Candidatus Omnitrophica bacterium]|nr:DegT/DnrJ/EryC1/StrS family aminotransferase [Candidatus Omnitrophota bacterium]